MGAVKMTAGVQQWTKRFGQRWIGNHGLARHILEPGMIDLRRQLELEYLGIGDDVGGPDGRNRSRRRGECRQENHGF